MLKGNAQLELSEYINLYEKIIPKENILRKIKENIDFSFVNPMLKKSYCEEFGRPAKEPEMMFKLLFLKKLYDLSDEKLMENANMHMAYKYFLDLTPEDSVADASLLTKFRKTRITEDMLEEMLGETVRQAVEKGLINCRMIIVDATHSKSSAKHETPTQILRRLTKGLRKELYRTQFDISERFPEKPGETSDLSEEIAYSRKLLEAVKEAVLQSGTKKAKTAFLRVEEALENDKIKEIQSLVDEDAKLGYKSEGNSFFGYKTHIAMTEERIITGLEVTTGEAPDGEYLQDLVSRSEKNGVVVEEITGDSAYSSKSNLEYARERKIKLISKLNPVISSGSGQAAAGFVYNKDADMFQCPSGNLSIRKAAGGKKNNTDKNQVLTYYFDIEKCKVCPCKGGCYKDGAKSKTYSVTILSETHKEQKGFQETEYFKERAKQRYMIEAKNAELKQSHGLGKADSVGVIAMRLQSYFSAFVVNTKRIIKLMEIKAA
jgi:IS5 family transposase